MKLITILGSAFALWLSAGVLQAQDTNEAEKFNQKLKQMQENFDKQQRQTRESFERMVREQQVQIDALKQQLDAYKTIPPTPAATTTDPLPLQPRDRAGLTQKWSPSDPIQLFGAGQKYVNVSFDGLFAVGTSTAGDIESLQLGGHDPKQRGFTVQNLETTFDGKVDPYFRGQANIIFQIDPEGESTLEAEEAYLETMSLPWNLQVKAGQFFTEFGRLNPTHPHAWSFVDQPLVNGRFLGADGLRNPGARISWLTPTPFYSELFLAVQNSQGETAHSFRSSHEDEPFFGRPSDQRRVKNLNDMLFAPRYAPSFDISDSQTLLAGASAAFGPNGTGQNADTQIYGIDLFWKWKPVTHHAGFPFVTWQSEAMLRRFQAAAFSGDADLPALPRETLTDYGFYSQIAYGFKKGWVAALRGDYLAPTETADYEGILGRDAERAERWRISPNLTWFPSEFSKLRLQYNYDYRTSIGNDHSVWLQFEFLLGAHGAHKF